MSKHVFDMVVSLLALLVLSPILGLLCLAVLVLDGRPVLFRQLRVGWKGKDFVLYKFRTMMAAEGAGDGAFDAGNTSRVTPVGRFLRRTKLDELPQIWNVLKGDMSLVGPRPEVRKWVAAYADRWRYIHAVKPGITDPASLVYRNEEHMLAESADPEGTYRNRILPHKLSLYEEYVRSRTFWGDLGILFRTVFAVLRGK